MNAPSLSAHATSDGIYVLRTTQQNQVQLNLMADQKANIIIGISLIFGTITQQQLVSQHWDDTVLRVPFVLLGLTMLTAFILAVLTVTPKLLRLGKCKAASLPNPLFFGFFPSVEEDDLVEHLLDEVKDPESSRELLIRDIYQTGRVLRRKYRLLRISYLCLGTGVLTSGLLTGIALLRT